MSHSTDKINKTREKKQREFYYNIHEGYHILKKFVVVAKTSINNEYFLLCLNTQTKKANIIKLTTTNLSFFSILPPRIILEKKEEFKSLICSFNASKTSKEFLVKLILNDNGTIKSEPI